MALLLLIEGDEAIGARVTAGLTAVGHQVSWQRTATGALREATQTGFDLVLLDFDVPDLDGAEVCRELRMRQPTCVLVMLASGRNEMDAVVSLEAGADDYLGKPFGLLELIARVRAHLRRAGATRPVTPEVFTDGDLVLDLSARRCSVRGWEVDLRTKEFNLLARLARSPGRAVTRDALMADVWDRNWSGSTKTLDVHVGLVRRRLADAAAQAGAGVRAPQIITLRGHGYRLDPVDAGDS